MRAENIERLKNNEIKIDNLNYLHYKSYHNELFNIFNKYATGDLLDIGCGNKPYEDKLLGKINKYVGVDITQSSEGKVDYLFPANNISLADNLFDTVLSTQTIEHVEDHQGLVNEAFRILKPNGIFILSGPLYWPLHEEPYDFFRFTNHGFKYILEKAGFQVLEVKSNGGSWSVAGQALIHALHPSLHKIKGFKGKILRKLFKIFGGVAGVNNFFEKIDDEVNDNSNTMNYIAVALKPINQK